VPRASRLQLAGGIFHATARGVRRQELFRDDSDRVFFFSLVEKLLESRRWILHAFCLMPNHYHLVVETPDADLSAGMQSLNGRYGQWFNIRYACEGHVFDRRFSSRLVESDWYLAELSRYVVLNPVRAGLCPHPSEWRWSSYRAMIGTGTAPRYLKRDLILGLFGHTVSSAQAAYEDFVLAGYRPLRMS
jgi:putative transposase